MISNEPNQLLKSLANSPGELGEMARHAIVDRAQSKCPFCRKLIKVEDFKDVLSKKEFSISGLCQACQDEVFKDPE